MHLGNITTPCHGIIKNQEKNGRYQDTFEARNEKEKEEEEEDEDDGDEDGDDDDEDEDEDDDENGEEIHTAKKQTS